MVSTLLHLLFSLTDSEGLLRLCLSVRPEVDSVHSSKLTLLKLSETARLRGTESRK